MVQASDSIRESAIRSREERKHRRWLERAEMRNAFFRAHGRFPGAMGYLGSKARLFVEGYRSGRAAQKEARAHPLFFVRRIIFWLWLAGAVGCFCAQAANDHRPSDGRRWAIVIISAAWPGVLVAAWVFHRFDFDPNDGAATPIAEAIDA